MKKYNINADILVSTRTIVEAKNESEAKDRFWEWASENIGGLCWQCSTNYHTDGEIDENSISVSETYDE